MLERQEVLTGGNDIRSLSHRDETDALLANVPARHLTRLPARDPSELVPAHVARFLVRPPGEGELSGLGGSHRSGSCCWCAGTSDGPARTHPRDSPRDFLSKISSRSEFSSTIQWSGTVLFGLHAGGTEVHASPVTGQQVGAALCDGVHLADSGPLRPQRHPLQNLQRRKSVRGIQIAAESGILAPLVGFEAVLQENPQGLRHVLFAKGSLHAIEFCGRSMPRAGDNGRRR